MLQLSFRQTIFLPVVGLVDADTMKPGDLVGVNKDSYLILDTLPSEYDSRVKAMEVRLTLHKSRLCNWRDFLVLVTQPRPDRGMMRLRSESPLSQCQLAICKNAFKYPLVSSRRIRLQKFGVACRAACC